MSSRSVFPDGPGFGPSISNSMSSFSNSCVRCCYDWFALSSTRFPRFAFVSRLIFASGSGLRVGRTQVWIRITGTTDKRVEHLKLTSACQMYLCWRFNSDASRCGMIRRRVCNFLVFICQYNWKNVHRRRVYICDGRHNRKRSKRDKHEALLEPDQNLIFVTRMYTQVRRYSGMKNHKHPVPTVPSLRRKVFRDAEPPSHIRPHIAVTTDMAVLPSLYVNWGEAPQQKQVHMKTRTTAYMLLT